MNDLAVTERILSGEPPRLPEGKFSAEVNLLVDRGLVADLTARASLSELLRLHWIQYAAPREVRLFIYYFFFFFSLFVIRFFLTRNYQAWCAAFG